MGTKVMVRASRSFNNYVEGGWYWVDPNDPHEGALIAGGYLEHQAHLFEDLDLEHLEGGPDGEVAAEPGEHPQDGPAEGPGISDPHSRASARRRKADRS